MNVDTMKAYQYTFYLQKMCMGKKESFGIKPIKIVVLEKIQ